MSKNKIKYTVSNGILKEIKKKNKSKTANKIREKDNSYTRNAIDRNSNVYVKVIEK